MCNHCSLGSLVRAACNLVQTVTFCLVQFLLPNGFACGHDHASRFTMLLSSDTIYATILVPPLCGATFGSVQAHDAGAAVAVAVVACYWYNVVGSGKCATGYGCGGRVCVILGWSACWLQGVVAGGGVESKMLVLVSWCWWCETAAC